MDDEVNADAAPNPNEDWRFANAPWYSFSRPGDDERGAELESILRLGVKLQRLGRDEGVGGVRVDDVWGRADGVGLEGEGGDEVKVVKKPGAMNPLVSWRFASALE